MLMDVPGMMDEFKGLRIRRPKHGPPVVEDKDRCKSHKDITETIAMCCYLVALEQLTGGQLGLGQTRQARRAEIAVPGITRARLSRTRGRSARFKPTRGIDPTSL